MKKIRCATYEGFDAQTVDVESTLTKGLPSFSIVGMANTAITESKERVKSALLSNGFTFPPKRITINLSPSDLAKSGSQFDLAVALLIALDHTDTPLQEWYAFGELGLDGSIKENQLLYPIILSLANRNLMQKAIVPSESIGKLRHIPGVEFYGVSHLEAAIALLKAPEAGEPSLLCAYPDHPSVHIDGADYYINREYGLDFADVKGQDVARRAALISAAGMHNLLLEGSPGSGKSMIAKRLHYILPPIRQQELLEIAKLESLEGHDPTFRPLRPFRSPHHSATPASIFGGGSHKAQIGEVGLAHLGVLFFDELPHYAKNVLEALREPLEDQKIRISRVHTKTEYPAEFLFVGAMNPCPCGNLMNNHKPCRCSDSEISRYKNRLSDPFLDRIDLYVAMHTVTADDRPGESSQSMHEKVIAAHRFRLERGQARPNGKLDENEVEAFCRLDDDARPILDKAIVQFALSFRSIHKVMKSARTIADLDQSRLITKAHLLEALSYRRR